MPKLKTHKALWKRVRVSSRGKIIRRMAGSSHLMSGTPSKKRRKLRRPKQIAKRDSRRMRRLLLMA